MYRAHTVESVRWQNHLKHVNLSGGRTLALPRSACVTMGERVLMNSCDAYTRCADGLTKLLPSYLAREMIDLGSLRLQLVIKEITEAEELQAYRSLSNYHYRDQPLFGRTARLIIQSFHPSYPKTIGYIELATPFYMSKSRTDVLNRPFRNGKIAWESWDKETARRAINLVVRIARCVIYPEFRGLGLGQMLLKHACEFARTRWQVGGLRPQFIEISADMLKYVPFAEKAGLHFIGETQGNLDRVANDIRYLLENRKRVKSKQIVKEEAFGIVDQQVARLDRATTLMKENGWTAKELVARLQRVSLSSSLRELNLLQHILSLPKPTYFAGLTPRADSFVRRAVKLIQPNNGFGARPIEISPLSKPIEFKGLTISHSSRVNRSTHTAAVQRAFGISPDEITHHVIDSLSFSVAPGQIAMIVGPSGSGKTSLLRFLVDSARTRKASRTGLWLPPDARLGTFEAIRSRRPLIESLHIKDIATALQLMGIVSLSDAFVYLKRFEELSAGQQYRALLAKLIASKANVWVADEFCVNLDPLAANSVAYRLGKLARSLRAALIVATPQAECIARSLRPDIVVRLTTAWEHEVMSGAEFLRHLAPRPLDFRVPQLRVPARVIPQFGRKRGTRLVVLSGRQYLRTGLLTLQAGKRTLLVNVSSVRHRKHSELSSQEIRDAGFTSRKSLLRILSRIAERRLRDESITLLVVSRAT